MAAKLGVFAFGKGRSRLKVYLQLELYDLDVARLCGLRVFERGGKYFCGHFGRLNLDGTFPDAATRCLALFEAAQTRLFRTPPFHAVKTGKGWTIWTDDILPHANLVLDEVMRALVVKDRHALDLRKAQDILRIARHEMRKQERVAS